MSNVSALIDVYRMTEVTKEVRVNMIIQLGKAINDEAGSNLTEPLVYELVEQLDPKNAILSSDHYKRIAGKL